MNKEINIRKSTDCLSREEITFYIDKNLSVDDKQAIDSHLASCELCREAIEGAKLFSTGQEYTGGLKSLEVRWSQTKTFSFGRNGKFYAIITIAASILILASIVSLLNLKNENRRTEALAYVDESGLEINSIIKHEGVIIRPTSVPESFGSSEFENEVGSEYTNRLHDQEQTIPLARLENASIYADESVSEIRKPIISQNQSKEETKSSYLKYPFRVMSHAPASLQMKMPEEEEVADVPFVLVEDMPRFNNSHYSGFLKFINSKLIYPVKAQNMGLSGRVYVQFTVTSIGQISDVKVLKSAHVLLDAEVVRVVKLSPEWEPGKQRGRAVDVSLVVPVDFILIQ